VRTLKIAIVVVVVAAAALGGYLYWHHSVLYPGTDDAYVQANVVSVAPQVSGRIAGVLVQDQQRVKTDQVLFELDRTPFELAVEHDEAAVAQVRQDIAEREAAVTAAQAQLNNAQVELANAHTKAMRAAELRKKNFISAQAYDDSRAQELSAQAQVRLAQAQLLQARQALGQTGERNAELRAALALLDRAQWELGQTVLKASCDGRIAKLTLRPGDAVQAGVSPFRLVCDKQFWVDANFQETDLSRIRVGQPATIRVDMYPGHIFPGRVVSVGPAAGDAFSLLPPENATGNWVKVTQRVPVRVDVLGSDPPPAPLRVGTSATVVVDTTSLGKAVTGK